MDCLQSSSIDSIGTSSEHALEYERWLDVVRYQRAVEEAGNNCCDSGPAEL